MNHLAPIGKIFLTIFFVLTVYSGVFAMDNTLRVTVDPPEFDVRHLMPNPDDPTPSGGGLQEFVLDVRTSIFPQIPSGVRTEGTKIYEQVGVNINLPLKVTVDIASESLNDFSWRKVPIPVTIAVAFGSSMQEKGISMSFYDRVGRTPPKKIFVYPNAWRDLTTPCIENDSVDSPYYRAVVPDGFGQSDYWNMTYFTELPKYSAIYDFWVTVRGVDSEKKPFSVEFYVDGQKVTEENFGKMSKKYPALKE